MRADPAAAFRVVIGAATLLMLALSWPLWVEGGEFPRVPFIRGLPNPSPAASRVAFGLLLATVAAGMIRRAGLGAAIGLLVGLVVLDQHRFQPWIYQYGMAALAFAATSRERAAGLCRLSVIALYLHSGLSKLDASFGRELGSTFLRVAVGPFGGDPDHWGPSLRTAAVLAMPLAELAVALGLAWRPTRKAALGGAVALHAGLIAILGPWGLDQSAIVLAWNGALIVEDLFLFGGAGGRWPDLRCYLSPIGVVFLVAALLPFGERRGRCDPWPAFALYASHVERAELSVPADAVEGLPSPLQNFARGDGPWRTIDLTAWSRSVRGVPIYPGGRASLGVARALATGLPGARGLRVVLWGPADRWTGRRTRVVAVGPGEIRGLAGRYRLNSEPAKIGGVSGMPDASRGGVADH